MWIDDFDVRLEGGAGSDTDWSPKIQQLLGYWQSKRRGGDIPLRRDIDPVEIPAVLPDSWMLDVVGDPPRFRFRLVGTRVAQNIGDLTGRWVDEIAPDFPGSDPHEDLVKLVRTRTPMLYAGPMRMLAIPYLRSVQVIELPLSKDGDGVDIVMGLTLFEYNQPAAWSDVSLHSRQAAASL